MEQQAGKVVNGVVRGVVRRLKRALGQKPSLAEQEASLRRRFPDFDTEHFETVKFVRPYTRTSPERIHALVEAVKYVSRNQIPGAIVECGVWRGGSMMAAAKTLKAIGDTSRELYLYDTYEGMSPPTEADVSHDGRSAKDQLDEGLPPGDDRSIWCYAPIEGVQQALELTGYPKERMHFVQGKVEETIPRIAPENIALLRLDTDWYESTKHELEQLYPRLARGGVLIIDDYGHWKGSRQATDEYIAANPNFGLLNRVDYTGRLVVKP